jgi:hypothetical protein
MPRNPRLDAPTRRSGRIASLPEQPDYRIRKANGDVKTESPDQVPVYATNEERAYAVAKAEQLEAQLGSDHPAFIKPMSHSSATKSGTLVWQLSVCCNAICSWMVICCAIWQTFPVHFKQYLPVHDEVMALVDEVNKEFDMLYHVTYTHHKYWGGYLNGWRAFSAHQELADGDCLVFQLIERRKFKVRFNLFSTREFRWVL